MSGKCTKDDRRPPRSTPHVVRLGLHVPPLLLPPPVPVAEYDALSVGDGYLAAFEGTVPATASRSFLYGYCIGLIDAEAAARLPAFVKPKLNFVASASTRP